MSFVELEIIGGYGKIVFFHKNVVLCNIVSDYLLFLAKS